MPSLGLSVAPDSPGSSIFDLPAKSPLHTKTSTVPGGPSREYVGFTSTEPKDSPSFLVISGGTGCNSICSAFGNACYVLPVSDDGGSSSEIIRVLGGPSIGDIRSRLIRLIPPSPAGSPLDAIRNLLAHRFPADMTEREARDEWRDVVEGRSALWTGIPNDRKELIRGFLVHFESELLKRAQKNFSFLNGSVGNYFLAAAQEFFRSLPSAIFLFSSITNSQANILPVIITNHTVTIAAELENGDKIVGQCNISHPVSSSAPSINVTDSDPTSPVVAHPQNVMFRADSKDDWSALESRISRLYYINAYGNEIQPAPNPDYLANIATNDVLVYSCGSLWTSIIPCLALRGVATAIARSPSLRAKVLLLNSKNDRETADYTAVDYIEAIVRSLKCACARRSDDTYPTSAFITHLVYLRGTSVPVEIERITAMGVACIEVDGQAPNSDDPPLYDAPSVRQAIDRILRQEN
ncbi:UPF0052-domain-containing protein [Gloeophyllum trabeum ATCC 11539]|uniref:UPF0052-domain-containing protein n=1 Tax=Gloeophyllum trabeum (strain ATCC 11539 / FP-39264 / Madison 617) TaxID=670483 RepID=S7S153_GLOTA|nr:UPF0052-domain-containing protein [Gloeophyllum trabeum ATCC 11539]EPQ61135.1 UPF0052-domain-containing protein [Gloeophyllum trabeum ATCC 11539]